MQEFDLEQLWEEAGAGADEWYTQLRPALVQTARQQNQSVLQRLRRLMLSELLLSLVGIVLFAYFGQAVSPWVYGTFIGLLVIVSAVSYRQYRRFRTEIDAVPTLNIVASTRAYLHIITRYRQRLFRLTILVLPLALGVGFIAGYSLGSNDYKPMQQWHFWLRVLPLLVAGGVFMYFLTTWYYRFFIGRKEEELQQLLRQLENEAEVSA